MGPTQTNEREPIVREKSRGSWWTKFKFVLFLVTAFYLGLAVGDGRIPLPSLGGNQAVSKNLPATLDYNGVNQLYKSLKDNYDGQLTAQQLEDGLKHGLASSTKDPYTSYFTPAEAKEFKEQITNSFSGIGAQLGQDEEGNLEVVAPIEGLPADKAGLRAKDLIATINGESTTGMSVDKAVSKIRGVKGSTVKLQVVRNRAQSLNFTITRDDIKLPSVKSRTLENNVGYIQITDFSDDTVDLVTKAAREFKEKNVKGIVLDMRDNPGGLLDASVKISDLWLPANKNILQEKRGNNVVVQSYNANDGDDVLKGVPTVILINSGSASASEITAGALRDNRAAYVIGEKSYGKGVVQQLINFGDGSQLKVTVASWYRPNGQNINKKGITPDKTVKLTDKDLEANNDTQLKAAEAYLNK